MMDLISIVVPVYNVEQYLSRCVDSIISQSYSNIEIILVDDGSPDNSGAICDNYAKQDGRIKVIHKANGGLGKARNTGIEKARGDYITFIDSDDWIGKNHISDLYYGLKNADADICFGGCTRAFSNGRQIVDRNNYRNNVYKKSDILDKILLPMVGASVKDHEDVQFQSSVCMSLYSLELIKENGVQFVSEKDFVAEDVFFNITLLSLAKAVCCIPIVSYYYFVNVESISQKYDKNRLNRTVSYYTLMMRQLAVILDDPLIYEDRVKRSFLVKIRVLIKQIVASTMSHSDKYKCVTDVVNNPQVREAVSQYPISLCVPDVKVVLTLIKKKKIQTLIMLMTCKQWVDSSPGLRTALRRIRGLQ